MCEYFYFSYKRSVINLQTTYSHVDGNLLVSADTERSDGVASCKIKENVYIIRDNLILERKGLYPWSKRASCQ